MNYLIQHSGFRHRQKCTCSAVNSFLEKNLFFIFLLNPLVIVFELLKLALRHWEGFKMVQLTQRSFDLYDHWAVWLFLSYHLLYWFFGVLRL